MKRISTKQGTKRGQSAKRNGRRPSRFVTDFDALFGQGKEMWKDDAEFEEFLAELRRWRKEERKSKTA